MGMGIVYHKSYASSPTHASLVTLSLFFCQKAKYTPFCGMVVPTSGVFPNNRSDSRVGYGTSTTVFPTNGRERESDGGRVAVWYLCFPPSPQKTVWDTFPSLFLFLFCGGVRGMYICKHKICFDDVCLRGVVFVSSVSTRTRTRTRTLDGIVQSAYLYSYINNCLFDSREWKRVTDSAVIPLF
jgi:hypothetical protein